METDEGKRRWDDLSGFVTTTTKTTTKTTTGRIWRMISTAKMKRMSERRRSLSAGPLAIAENLFYLKERPEARRICLSC